MINNKLMDMKRVDIRARLNTTEIWQIENVVGMDHPFHLHGFQFQVLDRDGVPEPYLSWKDSVNVPKHSKVRIAVRFENFPGKWMYHCHILDHEDMGMMGILEVALDQGGRDAPVSVVESVDQDCVCCCHHGVRHGRCRARRRHIGATAAEACRATAEQRRHKRTSCCAAGTS